MLVLGLTGGIACGKSNVSSALRELGAEIIDGDVLSRELTAPGGEALPGIRAALARGCFTPTAPWTAGPWARPFSATRKSASGWTR